MGFTIAYVKTLEDEIERLRAALALRDPNPERVFIDRIQQAAAEVYEVPLVEMKSARRYRDVARPRQAAMWVAYQATRQSLGCIGKRFGGRDHTTVMHAIRQIDKLRLTDEETKAKTDELLERIAPHIAKVVQ